MHEINSNRITEFNTRKYLGGYIVVCHPGTPRNDFLNGDTTTIMSIVKKDKPLLYSRPDQKFDLGFIADCFFKTHLLSPTYLVVVSLHHRIVLHPENKMIPKPGPCAT